MIGTTSRIVAVSFAVAVTAVALLTPSRNVTLAAGDGAELFKQKCVMCHAADGSGSPAGKKMNARDLRSPEVQKQTDAQLYTIIAKGKNKMPPYEAGLGRDKVNQLVVYVRELGKRH